MITQFEEPRARCVITTVAGCVTSLLNTLVHNYPSMASMEGGDVMSQWKCPHCHGPIGPVPDLVGQTVACPYCLSPIMVPGSIGAACRSRRLRLFIFASMLTGMSLAAVVAFYSFRWPDKLLDQQLLVQLASYSEQADLATATTKFEAYPNSTSAPETEEFPVPASPIRFEDCAVKSCAAVVTDCPLQATSANFEYCPADIESATLDVEPSPVSVDQGLEPVCTAEQAAWVSIEQSRDDGDAIAEKSPETLALATESVSFPYQRGLEVRRDDVIYAIQEYFDVEFYNQPVSDTADEEVTAEIEGAEVTLWGDASEIKSVTVSGRFDSDNMALLLATIISRVMPSWQIDSAGDWFTKAVDRCDEETFVSTLKDGVELTLMTAGAPGSFWVFFQPDRG